MTNDGRVAARHLMNLRLTGRTTQKKKGKKMESILTAIYQCKLTLFKIKNEQGAAHIVALEKVDDLEEK